MSSKIKSLLAASILTAASSAGHAQLEALGDFSAIFSADAMAFDVSALSDMGSMMGGGGDMPEVPFITPAMEVFMDSKFQEALIPAPPTDRFAEGSALVDGLILGAFANPDSVLNTLQELGVNAGYAAIPVLQVLAEDPASLADYFMGGGTILLPAAGSTGGSSGSVFPGAPLLTDPIPTF